MEKYLNVRDRKQTESLPNFSLIITFDDGYKGNYELLDVIKNYNIRPTVFLCSHIINTNRTYWFDYLKNYYPHQELKKTVNTVRLKILAKYGFTEEKQFNFRNSLSLEEIEKMSEYVDFQSHSKFHSILPMCNDDLSLKEIVESKEKLEEYGLKVIGFAYPNGSYTDRELKYVQDAGYLYGITVDCGFNTLSTDLYRLKRISISDNADVYEFIARVTGVWCKIKEIFK